MDCVSLIKVVQNGIGYKVPCGKCGFCLMSKRSQWMFRIYYEMQRQEHRGWFITLTYDEKHVKRTADGRLSLRFRDVQLFLKKLRKAKFYAKYICVGEYGSKTNRPHYHMLLWTDCPAERLEKMWSTRHGVLLGRIHFGSINMQSAMYTLKYIIQPKQGEAEGLEKTRAQFSKGLGLGYLTMAVYDWHTADYDNPVTTGMVDGKVVALPRYYRYKIFTKYQRKLEAFKLKLRKHKEERIALKKLWPLGIRDLRGYVQALKVENAKRVIGKSKLNEKI